jgi:hypothetical protein
VVVMGRPRRMASVRMSTSSLPVLRARGDVDDPLGFVVENHVERIRTPFGDAERPHAP